MRYYVYVGFGIQANMRKSKTKKKEIFWGLTKVKKGDVTSLVSGVAGVVVVYKTKRTQISQIS